MTAPTLTIAPEDPGTPDARALIDALSDTLERLTGSGGRASSDPATLRGEGSCFLVARDAQGRPVGCGAFRPLGEAPGEVEIKRMFARPGTRGVGAALLSALEAEARARGVRAARLETRRVNARALGFYARHGYVEIAPYGAYVGRPEAACLGKRLDGPP